MASAPRSVLFVCLGNIIRSPLCEGLFRHLMGSSYLVDSAAVTDDDLNQHPNPHSQRIAREHGFDISKHISRLVTFEDFSKFDIIVGLEPYVTNELKRMKPINTNPIIVNLSPGRGIPNPWCNPYKDFIPMYAQIEEAMNVFIKKYFPNAQ